MTPKKQPTVKPTPTRTERLADIIHEVNLFISEEVALDEERVERQLNAAIGKLEVASALLTRREREFQLPDPDEGVQESTDADSHHTS